MPPVPLHGRRRDAHDLTDFRVGQPSEETQLHDTRRSFLHLRQLGHRVIKRHQIKWGTARCGEIIDRYVDELRSEKTDISSLVELYSDMARRLAEILEGPAKK